MIDAFDSSLRKKFVPRARQKTVLDDSGAVIFDATLWSGKSFRTSRMRWWNKDVQNLNISAGLGFFIS